MVLMCQPKVLLLDEPAAGMNRSEVARLGELIAELRGRCAVVVIEHDMDFVRAQNCRTLVMHQGRLIRDASFAAIEADEEVRAIYLGRRSRHAAH